MIFRLAAALCIGGTAASAECASDRVDLRGEFGTARFSVELADDSSERAQGLMHRESLASSAGMLFVYERPQTATFWMRNTLIPLDMIFLEASGRVAKVHSNAIPLDETPIFGGDNILAVLEINGGLAARLGIDAGDELRHPALDQGSAVWRCVE